MTRAVTSVNNSGRKWQRAVSFLIVVNLGLLVALILVAPSDNNDDDKKEEVKRMVDERLSDTTCGGECFNPNGCRIDLAEADKPGPFRDLTTNEIIELRMFLENHPDIKAHKMNSSISTTSSFIFAADLWLPPKAKVLNFLDNNGPQPPRQARVMMFRGDKNPPVVEEWICGPLPDIQRCDLLKLPNRRNPVEWTSRPFSVMEFIFMNENVLSKVQNKLGHILEESYDASFAVNEDPMKMLTCNPVPVGSALTGDLHRRKIWIWFAYNVPYYLLHPTDMGVLLDLTSSNSSEWSVDKVWYSGSVYDSMDELDQKYTAGTISKTKLTRPIYSHDLYSTLHMRGDPMPPNPQRPPMLVEPDGKRYSIQDRKVDYMGWSFNFRMSPLTGPAIYDVRFKEERIAYEYALSEIAAFYSGDSPLSQVTDYVDSGAMSGLGSKSLVPGGDCPETATLVDYVLMNQQVDTPGRYDAVFCIFEQNNGYPLRRHLSYARPTGFYGGMLDSVLTLRSALVVGNYDYIIDFIFHQNGALETRLMSTGYIQTNILRDVERLYGWQIEENILGNIHHHMFHLKADLDVSGTSNRYETLDIKPQSTVTTWNRSTPYHQTMFTTNLKTTEKEALLSYNFETPKGHIVHNDQVRNKWGEKKSYRLQISGMSKNLLPQGEDNEPVISWARHQLAVTRHKDEEMSSSSNYGMYDSKDPVVDFSKFYADDENIVDEDLVFWMTLGLHHIPHTEDLPVTPTAGNHLIAWLLPYNYFPECPSMNSRDAIFIGYKNLTDPSRGVKVERNGNSRNTCSIPQSTLEEGVASNPDQVLQVNRVVPSF